MSDTPELLTLSEAAAILRTPADTLRYWRAQSKGPKAFRIGKRLVYRREDLDDFIANAIAADKVAA